MHTIVTIAESGEGSYTQTIQSGAHQLTADEGKDVDGGLDLGPAPYDFLLMALGCCTSMTLRMYARRKNWDLKKTTVTLTHHKETDAQKNHIDVITRDITLEGDLDQEQRQRLLEIADKCPVHRTLTDPIRPRLISTVK